MKEENDYYDNEDDGGGDGHNFDNNVFITHSVSWFEQKYQQI